MSSLELRKQSKWITRHEVQRQFKFSIDSASVQPEVANVAQLRIYDRLPSVELSNSGIRPMSIFVAIPH